MDINKTVNTKEVEHCFKICITTVIKMCIHNANFSYINSNLRYVFILVRWCSKGLLIRNIAVGTAINTQIIVASGKLEKFE